MPTGKTIAGFNGSTINLPKDIPVTYATGSCAGCASICSKHLLKAKELEALRSYEQKATDKIAATHLSNLKKAMNTAKNFERLNLQTVSQVLYCAIEKQKQAAELVKKAQRESLWNKSQQLKREQFSNQNLCHAPPTGQQVKKYLSSSKTFIHERVMSGGCSI